MRRRELVSMTVVRSDGRTVEIDGVTAAWVSVALAAAMWRASGEYVKATGTLDILDTLHLDKPTADQIAAAFDVVDP